MPHMWPRGRQKSGGANEPGADWRVMVTRRVLVSAVVLGAWAVGIQTRLVYLQIYANDEMVARAERQHMRTIVAPAKRGDIVDRQGRVLATSADVDTIYAVPSEIADAAAAVARLCEAFRDCTKGERQVLLERLGQRRHFSYVRRQVSPEEAKRVAALNLDGIGFMKESRRFYPKKELASHVLGYVGVDNKGLGGLESAYDSEIRGNDGTILVQNDARRRVFSRLERPPTAGSSIELTLDEYLQHIAERELHAGIVKSRAVAGTVIVMDPKTGEILAMANQPTFNPNTYRQSTGAERRNRAVQDLYEPGSTFKVITASAAIEEKVMPVDAPIDVSGGLIRVGSRVVHDVRDYGQLSFTDVMVRSSNVGAIKIGFKVGAYRLSQYVQRFGFGRPISSDFPGESPGIVWDPAKWTESALMSVSMGYQVGVTPLQMAAAISSVANGGELVEPRAVRAVYRDDRRHAVTPRMLRRTISASTAATLASIMEEIVGRGTGRAAQVPGYTVAGKTGTAAKLVGGRYSNSEYNASFVGFLPSRDPVVTIVVVIDAPHTGRAYASATHGGGAIAAPIFQRVAESTLRYLGVPPTINPSPPVLVVRPDEADPRPPAAAEDAGMALVRFLSDVPAGTVPDVRGMSAREAMRTLATLGLSPRVSGDGFVVSQDPAPGLPLVQDSECLLILDRQAMTLAAGGAQP